MNEAHFHLMVNHLPVIFPLVGVFVLGIGIVYKSQPVIRIGFMIFILAAIAAIFAINSGEGAEEIVEHLDGVSETYIHAHEEIAEKFAILTYLLAGFSVLGLWASFKQKPFSIFISISTLFFAFVVLYFAKQTSTTGGEIRHTEIREGYKSNIIKK